MSVKGSQTYIETTGSRVEMNAAKQLGVVLGIVANIESKGQ